MNKYTIAFIAFATLLAAPLAADPPASAALAEKSLSTLMELRDKLGLDPRHTFKIRSYSADALGQTHVRLQQFYRGVRVWGGEVITHIDAEGKELPMTAALQRGIDLGVTPALSQAEALAIVGKDLAPRGPYVHEPVVELVIYPDLVREVPKTRMQLPESQINAAEMESRVAGYRLAYYVHTVLDDSPEGMRATDYLIDAGSGEIIRKWNALETEQAVGVGKSQYSGVVSLSTNRTGSGFELRDLLRGNGGNTTNDMAHQGTKTGPHDPNLKGTVFTDPDNTWGDGLNYNGGPTGNDNGQTAGVEAHYGLATAWDMYGNVYGRNGLDGQGTVTFNRVHYATAYNNAFWLHDCFCMTYGDGDGTKLISVTSLDIVAHELSHGVNRTTANLIYFGESGGLNESNSDISGAMADFYAYGANGQGGTIPANLPPGTASDPWTIGERNSPIGKPIRWMWKPSKDGKSPDAWSPKLAGLDPHYSSGPMNRAFYFLSQGGKSDSASEQHSSFLPDGMAGIGNDKSSKIWFRNLTTYLTSGATYADARAGAVQSAKDLYGAGGPEEAAVWNAFAAINVGQRWLGGHILPSVAVQPRDFIAEAGKTAAFSVTVNGTEPLTYQWRRNGADVPGANAATYTTLPTTPADDGAAFAVAVSNPAGSVTSDSATLTVVAVPADGNLIRNGGFESGPDPWSGNTGKIGAWPTQPAHGGTNALWLGGKGAAGTETLAQTVAIPGTVSQAILTFWLHIDTAETTNFSRFDKAELQIRDGAGAVLATLASYSNLDQNTGYVQKSFDLGAYKGRTVQFYFSATEDVSKPTSFVIDDVSLSVSAGGGPPDLPPTVSVSESGSSGMITLSADARDDQGVVKVEFYVDNLLKGTDTSTPYTLALDSRTLADGSHVLFAKAYDTGGNVATSAPLGFAVNNGGGDPKAPDISVSAEGSSGVIRLRASASDNVGVTQVEFYVDSLIRGSVATPPYTLPLDSTALADGRHTLVGKAYDAAGNVGTSSPVAFTVANGGTGRDLILNGGFESGSSGWSGTGRIGSFSAKPAYEGSQCAWLGGQGKANSTELYQAVTIPAAAASASLSFALHIDSAEKSTWLNYDTAVVQVRSSSGSVLGTLATYGNRDKGEGYQVKSFDLGAYKGQTIQVYIKVSEDATFQTSFVFDRVSLVAR